MKLQVAELQDYKDRYDKQAQVQLRTKETEIEELHKEIDSLATDNSAMVKQINGEKELLINQNCELKKELAKSKLDQELLKSQVEGYHTEMQTLRAELQTEKKHLARIKACSSDILKLEEELQFSRQHNKQMQEKVDATHAEMLEQQEIIEEKLVKILEEKAAVEDENNSLCQDIKSKDEIIKQLTRENLTVNSNLT